MSKLLIYAKISSITFFCTLCIKSAFWLPDYDNTEKKKETPHPAQDKLTAQLNVLNESIISLVDLERKIGLTSESKNHMKSLLGEGNH